MQYADNPKSHFDYEILEKIEAGIALSGYETKAVKAGKATIKGSYVKIFNNQAYLVGGLIAPYQAGNEPVGYDSQHDRKLLLNKKELNYLNDRAQESGITLVPIRFYDKHGLIKLEIGIARGKKKYDKREVIKKRDINRQIQRATKKPSQARRLTKLQNNAS